jgi:hypothetical protein
MLEDASGPRQMDFTTHVFPPTPGVPQAISRGRACH